MYQIVEEITNQRGPSKYVDQASGVSARLSLANFRTLIASARQRGVVHNERPAVPRISDLGHIVLQQPGQTGIGSDGHPSNE